MNIIDKVISAVNPQKGLERVKYKKAIEIYNSGYSNGGASYTRKSLSSFNATSLTAKEDINDNHTTLVQRSRTLYQTAPMATSAIKTTRTNVVGGGLTLKPNLDYKYLNMSEEQATKWKDNVKRHWDYFCESSECDIMGLDNFYELQQLAFINQLMSGDCFVLLPSIKTNNLYNLKIQLIEADMVDSPFSMNKNINKGVEIKDNRVVAYHIAENSNYNTTYKRIPVYGEKTGEKQVLHLMNRERVGQTRGVPILAPVIESLKQLERYTHAELVAAVVSGVFAVFIKTNSVDGETGEDDYDSDDEYERELSLGNGTISYLDKDQDITVANPGRPNQNFDGFVNSIVRQIGASLEIPSELLMKHFDASYSASRGALLEAWKMFKMHRKWFTNDFCQPIYEKWLSEAVAKGHVDAPGFFTDPIIKKAYCKAEWYGDSNGQLDPLKEVRASVERVKSGLSSYTKEAQELTGTDFNDNIDSLKKEQASLNEVFQTEKPPN